MVNCVFLEPVPPTIGKSYLAQSRSDRSINSTIVPATTVRIPTSADPGIRSDSEYEESSSSVTETGSDDEDEEDDSVLTGTFSTRIQRFCWALCCACCDCCCRCIYLRKKTRDSECCRLSCLSRSKAQDPALSLQHIPSCGATTSTQDQEPKGCWPATVRWVSSIHAKWVRFRNCVRDKVEFAEHGKTRTRISIFIPA